MPAGGGGMSRSVGDVLQLSPSLAPVAGTGSAQNGAWIDRNNFYAALIALAWSTSGGVTGGTIAVKLQDATDGSGTGALDFGTATTVNIPAGPNASGIAEVVRSLESARRFIRVVVTSIPTGGTPASIVAAPVALMAPNKLPV